MKSIKMVALVSLFLICSCGLSLAHFGMVIPSDNMVMQDDSRNIQLLLSFSHPFEMVGMDLVKPASFIVFKDGVEKDITASLENTSVMGTKGFKSNYVIKRPGAYVFAMTPQPYWEPAEDCYIVHYTKTVVAAFGDDEGWDAEVGLKTEIVPLSKPFALYAGNLFQGIVKLNGKPVPYAEVEIEYYNQKKKAKAPTDYMVTQAVKADANGVFSYVAPAAGWWGFSALSTSEEKMDFNGTPKDIELGAVLWVNFENWQE